MQTVSNQTGWKAIGLITQQSRVCESKYYRERHQRYMSVRPGEENKVGTHIHPSEV